MKTVLMSKTKCSPKYSPMHDIEELSDDDVDLADETSHISQTPILECSSSQSSNTSSSSSIVSVVSSLSCDDDSLVGDNYEILRGSDILLNEADQVNDNGVTQHTPNSTSIDIQNNGMDINRKNDVIIKSGVNKIESDPAHNSIFRKIAGRRQSHQTSPNRVTSISPSPNAAVRNNIRPPRTLFRDNTTGHVKIIPQNNHLNSNTGSHTKPPRICRNPSEISPIRVSLSTTMSQSSASYHTNASNSITRPMHRRVVSNTSLLSDSSSHIIFPIVGYSSDIDTSTNHSSSYTSRRTHANLNNSSTDIIKDDPAAATMQEADQMLKRKKNNFVKQEMKYLLRKLQSSKLKKPVNAKVKLQRSKNGCLT